MRIREHNNDRQMGTYRLLLLLTVTCIFSSSLPLISQPLVVYPKQLYSGMNVITLKAAKGIRSIQPRMPDTSLAYLAEIRSISSLDGCPQESTVEIILKTANRNLGISLVVELCDGTQQNQPLLNRAWTLDEVPLEDVYVGDTACNDFRISTNGAEMLDSITIDAPNAYARYSFPPPIQLSGVEYRYEVCFVATQPGLYRFPVITWIGRDQPSGGYTNYAVADTGVIRVKPRPGLVKIEEIPFDTAAWLPITDPTTFRSVAVPNAIIPLKGRWFVGSYDLLGLTAGYSLNDNLLVFAGGAIPTPDDWGGVKGDMFSAWSIGAKGGTELFDKFNIAGGYHFGQSTLDKESTPDELDSRITVHVPYGAISYGTDDSRISVTGGYAFKRHSTWITTDPVIPPFRDDYSDDAAFVALGGDYRLAKHWKIAGETVWLGSVDVLPVIATGRYFTERFAIDFGMAYAGITLNDAKAPPVPIAPILSAIFVF